MGRTVRHDRSAHFLRLEPLWRWAGEIIFSEMNCCAGLARQEEPVCANLAPRARFKTSPVITKRARRAVTKDDLTPLLPSQWNNPSVTKADPRLRRYPQTDYGVVLTITTCQLRQYLRGTGGDAYFRALVFPPA
jgi:hypothetical protein